MKCVGILTRYYNSTNYGGVLQSYALNKFLLDNNIECETICYDFEKTKDIISKLNTRNKLTSTFLPIIRSSIKLLERVIIIVVCPNIVGRYRKFKRVRDVEISHSTQIYSFNNIALSENVYNCYITGSDRVWITSDKTELIDTAFFLQFVNNSKRIAYSASTNNEKLSVKEQLFYQSCLNDFDAISVREDSFCKELNTIIPHKNVVNTLDPVFLIDKKKWIDCINEKQDVCDNSYIFVYLLFTDHKIVESINHLSDELGLTIRVIPYVGGKYNKYEKKYKGVIHASAGPFDFIELIYKSRMVITDSFHCASFSIIFNKDLFVINRDITSKKNTYSSRIINLFNILNINIKRIVEDPFKILQIADSINYTDVNTLINQLRDYSREFLVNSISER